MPLISPVVMETDFPYFLLGEIGEGGGWGKRDVFRQIINPSTCRQLVFVIVSIFVFSKSHAVRVDGRDVPLQVSDGNGRRVLVRHCVKTQPETGTSAPTKGNL